MIIEAQNTPERFLAVDALRTVALLLLIVYHATVLFQPWSAELGWIQNDEVIPQIWPFMEMLNVWRIPILFWLSGMGVRFAMERRNNWALLKERSLRILLPYLFGCVTFGAICIAFDQYTRGEPISYEAHQYHLWFLGNMYVYVLVFLPFARWIQQRPNGWATRCTEWLLRSGWFIPVFAAPYMIIVPIIIPEHFSAYAETQHGFLYGAVCFFLGFLSANSMHSFQQSTIHWRWRLSVAATLLWGCRMVVTEDHLLPHYWVLSLTALESMWWILAIMGHAFFYWKDGFTGLGYAANAVYPVYIFHQPLQNGLAIIMLAPLWNPWLELSLLIIAILSTSVLLFEITRRVRWIRPLIGLHLHGRVRPR